MNRIKELPPLNEYSKIKYYYLPTETSRKAEVIEEEELHKNI